MVGHVSWLKFMFSGSREGAESLCRHNIRLRSVEGGKLIFEMKSWVSLDPFCISHTDDSAEIA